MGLCISYVSPESKHVPKTGSGDPSASTVVATTHNGFIGSVATTPVEDETSSPSSAAIGDHIKGSTGLLYKDYSTSATDAGETAALFGAIKKGHVTMVHSLLADNSRAAFATGMWGSTSLIAAAQYNKFDVANTLLDHILSFKYNNSDDNSNDANALKLEIDIIRHVNEKKASVLLYTCMWGDVSFLERLLSLDSFASGHTQDFTSEGPYLASADVLAHSLPLHNPITDRTESASPLSVSICNNHPAVLTALLEHLSQVRPVQRASYANHRFPFAIEGNSRKAFSKMYCNCGISLLQLAIMCGNVAIFDDILKSGDEEFDAFSVDDDGCGVLHYIAKFQHTNTSDICEYLRASDHTTKLFDDIDVINATDKHGNSPLLLASECGNEGAAEVLLSHGASVAYANPTTMSTPLHLAVTRRHIGLVNLLLNVGEPAAQLFAVDCEGASPLTLALKMSKTSEIYIKLTNVCDKCQTARDISSSVPTGDVDSTVVKMTAPFVEPFKTFNTPDKKAAGRFLFVDGEEKSKAEVTRGAEYTGYLASVDIEPVAPVSPSGVVPSLGTFPSRLERMRSKNDAA